MRLIVLVLLLAGALALVAGRLFPGALGGDGGAVVPRLEIAPPTPIPPPDLAPRAQPNAQRGEVAVEITEAELSRQLDQQLVGRPLGQTPLGAATLESIQVALRNGRADTTGTARLGGASVPYSSLISPIPDAAGRVQIRVSDAKVGGVPVPEAARAEIEAAAQREIDRLLARQPIRVRTIEIGDGRLRAIGSPA